MVSSDDPIRILHVFGTMNRGGAEMRTVEMMRNIDRERFKFEFCSLSGMPGDLDEEILGLGGEVHHIKRSLGFPTKFRALLRARKFEIVHSHVHHSSGFVLKLAAAEGVVGRIAHYRSTGFIVSFDQRHNRFVQKIFHAFMKRWIRHYATDIWAVSEAAMAEGWDAGWWNDPRCQVIYSGVESPTFDYDEVRSAIRRELGIAADEKVCIHIGNATPAKNHARLIEVFSELSHRVQRLCLLMVGEIPQEFRENLHKQSVQWNSTGRLMFTGVRSDVTRLLSASDLMLFPSTFEGLPGAVLEAAAVGLPVLASDIGPVAEIAAHTSVVHRRALSAPNAIWAACAAELLSSERLGLAREQALAEFARSPFHLDTMLQKVTMLYESRARDRRQLCDVDGRDTVRVG